MTFECGISTKTNFEKPKQELFPQFQFRNTSLQTRK